MAVFRPGINQQHAKDAEPFYFAQQLKQNYGCDFKKTPRFPPPAGQPLAKQNRKR